MRDFYGLPTRTLSNDYLQLDYLADTGPRLVRLFLKQAVSQENFLAELPQASWPTVYGEYYLRGGHRLWHGPEAMPRSSIPEGGLEVIELPDGVQLCQPVEGPTGIRKRIEVHLDTERAGLTLKHDLTNEGLWPVELTPWAITQLALGGVAVLPQTVGPLDAPGLLPNRHMVFWPYTRSDDKRLEVHDDLCLVHGRPQLPPCKIGYLNRQGWAGYLNHDIFLVKRFDPQPERPHPDFGCNNEVYCNNTCLELETLGPLTRLDPGQAVTHIERWDFFTGLKLTPTLDEIRHLAGALATPVVPPAN